jgi:hypothetical protein
LSSLRSSKKIQSALDHIKFQEGIKASNSKAHIQIQEKCIDMLLNGREKCNQTAFLDEKSVTKLHFMVVKSVSKLYYLDEKSVRKPHYLVEKSVNIFAKWSIKVYLCLKYFRKCTGAN